MYIFNFRPIFRFRRDLSDPNRFFTLPNEEDENPNSPPPSASGTSTTFLGSTTGIENPWINPIPGTSSFLDEEAASRQASTSAVMTPLLIAESAQTFRTFKNISFGTFGQKYEKVAEEEVGVEADEEDETSF
jgi:hypothetical protein